MQQLSAGYDSRYVRSVRAAIRKRIMRIQTHLSRAHAGSAAAVPSHPRRRRHSAASSSSDSIEERWDEQYQQMYYLNTATGESGWTREEVEAMAAGTATGSSSATSATGTTSAESGTASTASTISASETVSNGNGGNDGGGAGHRRMRSHTIVRQTDPNSQHPYYMNQKTGHTGWTREEVAQGGHLEELSDAEDDENSGAGGGASGSARRGGSQVADSFGGASNGSGCRAQHG